MSYTVTVDNYNFTVDFAPLTYVVAIEQLAQAEIDAQVLAAQTAATNAFTHKTDAEAARDASQEARDQAQDYATAAGAAAGFFDFADLTALLDDTSLTYTAGQPGTVVVGDIIRTRKEDFSYEVLASGASGDITNSNATPVQFRVISERASPRAFGEVGDGADDQDIFNRWFAYFLAGNPVVLDCELRMSAASIAHPGLLQASGNLDMTATKDGKLTYVGTDWIYRMIAIDLEGFDCFADFGFVDGNNNAGKGVHLSNRAGNSQANTVKVSCEGQDFRAVSTGASGFQIGVMSFSGGCEHFIVDKWYGENITGVAGNLDALQMFVISADEAAGLYPKYITVKDHYSHNIKFDDYTTRATSDADGLVVFGLVAQDDGSCVIENSRTSEISGRGLKLAHKFAVVKNQSDYRSIQGHTATAGIGATSCAFQYGTGIHENLNAIFEGANVFNKNADVLVQFSTSTAVQPSVRARREVGSVSVTCKNTGTTNGLLKLVDFRAGFTMTEDVNYTSVLKSATMAGGFTDYVIGVRSSGFAGRPQRVYASNIRANIKTAFAAADANMTPGDFVMHIENVQNTKGSDVPVIARVDAVDMNGIIGQITGGGIIEGISRSRGVAWPGLDAGYAPAGSKYRSPSANRTSFNGAKVSLFDEMTINSASGTLTSPCAFPCVVQVETNFAGAGGMFHVSNTGAVTQVYNTNPTHLQAQAGSEPASGTYRLWTTNDYSGIGGTIHFKTTDGTLRFFEVVANF